MVLPKGWADYKPIGDVIPGTRLVAFKTPLKKEFRQGLSKEDGENTNTASFTPYECCKAVSDNSKRRYKLGLVLNLTFTTKYYDPQDFERNRVHYAAVMCPGHEIPNDQLVHTFQRSIQNYLYDYPRSNTVVGVHCTHGVNRSGYMIARYLIQCERWSPEDAISAVGEARGHPIERENYLLHLQNLHKPSFLFPKPPFSKKDKQSRDTTSQSRDTTSQSRDKVKASGSKSQNWRADVKVDNMPKSGSQVTGHVQDKQSRADNMPKYGHVDDQVISANSDIVNSGPGDDEGRISDEREQEPSMSEEQDHIQLSESSRNHGNTQLSGGDSKRKLRVSHKDDQTGFIPLFKSAKT